MITILFFYIQNNIRNRTDIIQLSHIAIDRDMYRQIELEFQYKHSLAMVIVGKAKDKLL